jgi:hypothetical protein
MRLVSHSGGGSVGNDDSSRPAAGQTYAIAAAEPLFKRRTLLRSGASAALLPLIASSCSSPSAALPRALPADLEATLAAFADRIIPADASGPGAAASGVGDYINRSLIEWNQADLPLLSAGLQALEQHAAEHYQSQSFSALDPTRQDALLQAMEAGELPTFPSAQQVFNRLHRLVLEGMFSDPYYGGNRDYAGWDLIGYPGAVLGSTVEMQRMGARLPPLHTSAYGADHDGH